jgi:hypothetical protein
MGRARALALAALVALGLPSCGYRALYADADGERLHVALSRSLVPDAVASDEVLSGVREELAREGALAAGEGYPRVEVEVLRADESSEGVAAVGGAPRARGTEVGLVVRAWIVRAAGAVHERDTGDVRAMDAVGIDTREGKLDPRADALHHDDALRAVARRVGRRLAARLLGHPVAVDEGIGRER